MINEVRMYPVTVEGKAKGSGVVGARDAFCTVEREAIAHNLL